MCRIDANKTLTTRLMHSIMEVILERILNKIAGTIHAIKHCYYYINDVII